MIESRQQEYLKEKYTAYINHVGNKEHPSH
jgi:hypothetical protein